MRDPIRALVMLATAMLVMLMVLVSVAEAHHDKRHEPMEQAMEETMHWIAENTEYEYTTPPPFLFVPKSVLDYMRAYDQDEEYTGQKTGVQAMYLNHLVLFRDDINVENWGFAIVHELVHHLQYVNEKEHECHAAAEKEAYAIQAMYVEEFGGVMPDPMFVFLLRCSPIHMP